MQVTFLKHEGSIHIRKGVSSGPSDGAVLFEQGGFRDVSRYMLDHRPACDGDWFVKDVPYLPGKPTEPGAYWLRFCPTWVLTEVFKQEGTLWYRSIGQGRYSAIRQCRNLDGYVPLPAAPTE